MADLTEIIGKVEALEGAGDIVAVLKEHAAAVDSIRGEALASKKALTAAEKSRAALEADLAAARSGQGEEAAKLQAARDEAIARAAQLEGAIRSRDIRDGARTLFAGQGLSGSALDDAVTLYTSALPDGVELDGGRLVGAEASVKAFVDARPHLKAAPMPGNGGPNPSTQPRPSPPGKVSPADADRAERLAKFREIGGLKAVAKP